MQNNQTSTTNFFQSLYSDIVASGFVFFGFIGFYIGFCNVFGKSGLVCLVFGFGLDFVLCVEQKANKHK